MWYWMAFVLGVWSENVSEVTTSRNYDLKMQMTLSGQRDNMGKTTGRRSML